MHPKYTLADFRQAVDKIKDLPRPEGDIEGEPFNSPGVLGGFTQEQQEAILHVAEVGYEIARHGDGTLNKRGVTTLTKGGFPATLNQSQDDPTRLVGLVQAAPDIPIDISDPAAEDDDDEH